MITGNIIAVLFIAAIPWALALPVNRWHPAMQTAQARRSYRWFTYVVSLVLSVVSFFLLRLVLDLVHPGRVGVAIWLDTTWFRRSRTPAGHAAMTFAKEAARPRAPVYIGPSTGWNQHEIPVRTGPPAGWYQHQGVQRWWDGETWTERVFL